MSYQPTDEQIEALADTIEASSGGWHFTPDHMEKLGPLADFQAREVARSSAFQSIIRAAQAEAFDQGAQAQADGYGMQVDTINPYREDTTA